MNESKDHSASLNKAQNMLNDIQNDEWMQKDKEYIVKMLMKLKNEYESLFSLYQASQKKIERKNKFIEELRNGKKKDEILTFSGYDKQWTLVEKLVFILKQNKTRMNFKEINNTFLKLEPELKDKWSDPNKSISQILHNACKFKVIDKVKIRGGIGWQYYLPEKFQNNILFGTTYLFLMISKAHV